jgi:hypothetical protein
MIIPGTKITISFLESIGALALNQVSTGKFLVEIPYILLKKYIQHKVFKEDFISHAKQMIKYSDAVQEKYWQGWELFNCHATALRLSGFAYIASILPTEYSTIPYSLFYKGAQIGSDSRIGNISVKNIDTVPVVRLKEQYTGDDSCPKKVTRKGKKTDSAESKQFHNKDSGDAIEIKDYVVYHNGSNASYADEFCFVREDSGKRVELCQQVKLYENVTFSMETVREEYIKVMKTSKTEKQFVFATNVAVEKPKQKITKKAQKTKQPEIEVNCDKCIIVDMISAPKYYGSFSHMVSQMYDGKFSLRNFGNIPPERFTVIPSMSLNRATKFAADMNAKISTNGVATISAIQTCLLNVHISNINTALEYFESDQEENEQMATTE